MKRVSALLIALAAASAWMSTAHALDTVKRTDNSNVQGTIASISKFEVAVSQGPAKTTTVPVNEIVWISFDREPATVTSARLNIENGRYEDGLESLENADLSNVDNPNLKSDIEFYKALCQAKLALSGNGEIGAAGSAMARYAAANPDSFHFLEANELVGDLLVALGSYDKAQQYYRQLASAPWPDFKMRAGVLLGRAQLAEGNATDALQSFDTVLGMSGEGDLATEQKTLATIGKARVLAGQGAADQAQKLVEGVIENTDPQDGRLQARAYNALGMVHRAAGRNKDALLAYLHVDLLYAPYMPEAHAEALANLVELWKAVNRNDRANQAFQMLKSEYGQSSWAKKVGAGS